MKLPELTETLKRGLAKDLVARYQQLSNKDEIESFADDVLTKILQFEKYQGPLAELIKPTLQEMYPFVVVMYALADKNQSAISEKFKNSKIDKAVLTEKLEQVSQAASDDGLALCAASVATSASSALCAGDDHHHHHGHHGYRYYDYNHGHHHHHHGHHHHHHHGHGW